MLLTVTKSIKFRIKDVYRLWISERLLDISLAKENISARNSPQHSLEADDSFTFNDTSDEAKLLIIVRPDVVAFAIDAVVRSLMREKRLSEIKSYRLENLTKICI